MTLKIIEVCYKTSSNHFYSIARVFTIWCGTNSSYISMEMGHEMYDTIKLNYSEIMYNQQLSKEKEKKLQH